jgi:hypothetical protein
MNSELARLVDEAKATNDWTKEIDRTMKVYDELIKQKQSHSVRNLAKILGRNKTWVGDTLTIHRWLSVWPELAFLDNRFAALQEINKRKKLKRFIES